jgi:hypothetical protein
VKISAGKSPSKQQDQFRLPAAVGAQRETGTPICAFFKPFFSGIMLADNAVPANTQKEAPQSFLIHCTKSQS